jgi:hypothetical protein
MLKLSASVHVGIIKNAIVLLTTGMSVYLKKWTVTLMCWDWREMVDIRVGMKECMYLDAHNVKDIIDEVCINWALFIF